MAGDAFTAGIAVSSYHLWHSYAGNLPLPSPYPRYGICNRITRGIARRRCRAFSLFVDEGDITHPKNAARDLAWISSWLDVASSLGPKRVRIIVGKSFPSEEALDVSIRGFQSLLPHAETPGLRLMTENWYDLLSSPTSVHTFFQRLEGQVGFL